MSEEVIRVVPKCNDEQILRFYDKLSEKLSFQNLGVRISGSNETLHLNQHANTVNKIRDSRGFLIQHAFANRNSDNPNTQNNNERFAIIFERGQWLPNKGTQPSLYVDTIRISQIHFCSPATAIEIGLIVDDELVKRVAPALPDSDGLELSQLVNTHHQLITALHQQIAALGDEHAAARVKLEREIDKRKQDLEESAKIEKRRIKQEYAAQIEVLEKEREKIAEREKELDDRNNTHARRDLRKSLKENLASYKERFELTPGTRKLRQPITLSVLCLEIICIFLIVFYAMSANANQDVWDRIFFGQRALV